MLNKSLIHLFLISILIISCFPLSILANNEDIKVIINGELQSYEQPPVMIHNTTMVPLRGIFESLEAEVKWDSEQRSITATRNNIKIILPIGSIIAAINDRAYELEQPAAIINGNTMVPIRFVSEALGAKVVWDQATKTVIIENNSNEETTHVLNQQPNPELQTEGTDTLNELNENDQEMKLISIGKRDVSSKYASGKSIKNINYFELTIGEGSPIHIYVTDDYIKQYGEGYAYSEVGDMILSIAKHKEYKPYLDPTTSFHLFFYTNNSNTPLPQSYQAAAGTWGDDGYLELIINGSNMPYDFRTSLQHELYHYFDKLSELDSNKSKNIYKNYWGNDYRFWLLEGAAEYSSYFFYDYPKNTFNGLSKDIVKNTKEAVLNYAKQQGGNHEKLMFDYELNSFDDIKKASNNNYGITLSFFWYLVEQYNYETIYDYVGYISTNFNANVPITQSEKDETAILFFGSTEEEILKDWLVYFDDFGGFNKYEETTTGTANYILYKNDPLLSNDVRDMMNNNLQNGFNFMVNIEEWIDSRDHTQSQPFRDQSTDTFKLSADGYEDILVERTGAFYTHYLTNGEKLHAFQFFVPEHEASKMVEGVEYTLIPINNHPTYQWVIPEDIKIVK
ncbi:copper amine oxidase N-terminal domain-containing protein [Chengkuizengella axinellae]|uniref:Copper amine oxidase N-terminal domain-containing protein n=1 Tax=Chengkuizengella axinellae TaxID=3064388 RepID=A0ABT9IZX5_9BACL|nr:copper amine oxidase N-terminal domain-containing protein [Chengkuizengella sp. 2205SS18-9]MDP5274319.1 copper amine oxidase N-terminal domain-containing protein [Chengkuizengella sp. 2205SS18-9]